MLIVALVLAVIGLAALVTAVVTSNELIAWVCIGASVIGVLLLIVDALRERSRRDSGEAPSEPDDTEPEFVEDYPEEALVAEEAEAESDAETTVTEARQRADAMLADAQTRSEAQLRQAQEKADALQADAERKHSEIMGTINQQRTVLEGRLEQLRTFEREYRTRLKTYLESQLEELGQRGSAAPVDSSANDGGGFNQFNRGNN